MSNRNGRRGGQNHPHYRNQSRPAARNAALPDGPVRISTEGAALDDEREAIFYIDDREYTIPKRIRPNYAIRYLNDLRHRDSEYAVAQAMADLLGEEAMDALAACDHVNEEQMDQIMAIIEHRMTAAADRTLGNS